MFSFWEQESFIGKPDFIVLGSGIVGLNAAWEFKRLNPVARVVVCERGMIPFGASTSNAGFACFGSVSELLDDLDNGHSEAEVFGLVEKRWKGLLRLRKKLGDKNIGLENRGSYEIFTDKDSFERCMDNTGYLNHHLQDLFGTEDIYAVSKKKNFGFKGVKGMIINKKEGQIHTGKMMKTLIAKVQKIGVEIWNGVNVKHWTEENDAVILHLENGDCISAGRLLVCTNGFTSKILPHLEVIPARNQVLITEPIDNLPFKGCFHYEKGYYYFRNVGNRILFGGGRHLDKETEQTDERGFTDIIQEAQWKLLTEVILPDRKIQVASRWSGTLGIGSQKKPIIEKISPLVGVAVRMGGMGVAIGTLVGEEGALLMDTGEWGSDNG